MGCCLPAPAHQPFSFNNLGLSAPEKAGSRNVRASGTLKFGYEGIFKITCISVHGSNFIPFPLHLYVFMDGVRMLTESFKCFSFICPYSNTI